MWVGSSMNLNYFQFNEKIFFNFVILGIQLIVIVKKEMQPK